MFGFAYLQNNIRIQIWEIIQVRTVLGIDL